MNTYILSYPNYMVSLHRVTFQIYNILILTFNKNLSLSKITDEIKIKQFKKLTL